ncbi:hypothetical protein LQW54_004236 [Pestalotiopsis sp. IQ-011]
MPELPTLQKGEWVAENYDALLGAMRRDDVFAVTGYKANGLEVGPVLPNKGPNSSQQRYQQLRDCIRAKKNTIAQNKSENPSGQEGIDEEESRAQAKELADYILSTKGFQREDDSGQKGPAAKYSRANKRRKEDDANDDVDEEYAMTRPSEIICGPVLMSLDMKQTAELLP